MPPDDFSLQLLSQRQDAEAERVNRIEEKVDNLPTREMYELLTDTVRRNTQSVWTAGTMIVVAAMGVLLLQQGVLG